MYLRNVIFTLCVVIDHVISSTYEKPLAKKLWEDRCTPHSMVLNDCNWCWCDKNYKFQCDARVCSNVDMFGHFKDAIQDIKVGMEGHGSWRSTETPCSAGVHYRRGGVLCVCDENGDWPNPVCRDLFRVLYSVEVTTLKKVSGNESCLANKLYLVDCNVCICPTTEYLDAKYCTQKKCGDVEAISEGGETANKSAEVEEIYATCDTNNRYLLGCRQCQCLRNNRLICDNCIDRLKKEINKSHCKNRKPGKIFNFDCNLCYCDKKSNMLCTARKCLRSKIKQIKHIMNVKHTLRANERVYDDSCAVGHHNTDCNTCRCIKNEKGEKFLDCTARYCNKTNPLIHDSCVKDTAYELNCMICVCEVISNEKRQVCRNNPKCFNSQTSKEKRTQNAREMRGYCEPLHIYKLDCNKCQCLVDGKTLKCTSKVCTPKPLSVNVLPYKADGRATCPEGQSYKLGCNYCFCLSNGNSICTTLNCNEAYNNS